MVEFHGHSAKRATSILPSFLLLQQREKKEDKEVHSHTYSIHSNCPDVHLLGLPCLLPSGNKQINRCGTDIHTHIVTSIVMTWLTLFSLLAPLQNCRWTLWSNGPFENLYFWVANLAKKVIISVGPSKNKTREKKAHVHNADTATCGGHFGSLTFSLSQESMSKVFLYRSLERPNGSFCFLSLLGPCQTNRHMQL